MPIDSRTADTSKKNAVNAFSFSEYIHKGTQPLTVMGIHGLPARKSSVMVGYAHANNHAAVVMSEKHPILRDTTPVESPDDAQDVREKAPTVPAGCHTTD